MAEAVFLATFSYSTLSLDEMVTSPPMKIWLPESVPLTIVSTATLALGSMDKHSSRIASEIMSQSLSGWPSDTDSEVKR